MRKVLRGHTKDRDDNLILIGTIPAPHSKDKPFQWNVRTKEFVGQRMPVPCYLSHLRNNAEVILLGSANIQRYRE